MDSDSFIITVISTTLLLFRLDYFESKGAIASLLSLLKLLIILKPMETLFAHFTSLTALKTKGNF